MPQHPGTSDFFGGFKPAGFAQIHGARGFAGAGLGRAATAAGAAAMPCFHAGFVPAFFVAGKGLATPGGHEA